MPTNPNIPLGVRGIQLDDPVEKVLTLRKLAQQEQMQQMQMQDAQEERAARQEAGRVQGEVGGAWPQLMDPKTRDETIKGLSPQARGIAMKHIGEWDTHRATAMKAQTELSNAKAKSRAALARGVIAAGNNPEAARLAFSLEAEDDPSVAELWNKIGQDPAKLPAIMDLLVKQDPDYKEPEKKTRIVTIVRPDGTKIEQIVEDKPGQTFESAVPPETPKEKSARLFQEAQQRETARHNRATEAASTRSADIAAAKQTTTKPSSGAEKKALNFFNRAEQAHKDIEAIEGQIQGQGYLSQKYREMAPNVAQSDLNQSYEQAQRAFTEARLRKESGATIPKDEYENDRKTYFAVAGDSKAVLEQKRRARSAVLSSLAFESGNALNEYVGDSDEAKKIIATYKTQAQKSGDEQGTAGPDLSGLAKGRGRKFTEGPFAGQTWTVGADGQPMQVK